MRLIDADKLKEDVLKWMPNDPCGIEEKEFPFETDIVVSLMMEIEEAPTIEPKRGEWIDKGWEGDWQFETDGRGNCWHEYECSECGFYSKGSKSNFCPNCGTRMKGEDDE